MLAKHPGDRFDSLADAGAAIRAVAPEALGSVLVLPRPESHAGRDEPPPAAIDGDSLGHGSDAPVRYQAEVFVARTPVSTLHRALDSALDRSVVMERFEPGACTEELVCHRMALARFGGPGLQRTLSFDRERGVAVYEAPVGQALSRLAGGAPWSPSAVAALVSELALGLLELHEADLGHGGLSPEQITVDDDGRPTLLVAGCTPRAATPRDDVDALTRLASELTGQPLDFGTCHGAAELWRAARSRPTGRFAQETDID